MKFKINEEKKKKMAMKYQEYLKVDTMHRARMDREICIYLLHMARNSSDKEARRKGRQLLNLIKEL
jgi:hypothetical protein